MYINEPFLKASNSPNSQSNKKQRTTTAKQISEYKFTNNNSNNNNKTKVPKTNIKVQNTKGTLVQNRENKAKDTANPRNYNNNINNHKSRPSQIVQESDSRSSNNVTNQSRRDQQLNQKYEDIGRFDKKKVLDLIGDSNHNTISQHNNQQSDQEGDEVSPGVDQAQFQDYLLKDLTKLIKKWNRKLNIVQADLQNYEGCIQSQSQINAFKQCVQLLNAEFDQAQAIHEASRDLIEKKVLQVDDYKLRLVKQAEQLRQQIKDITKQTEQIQQMKKDHEKKKNTKKLMLQKLAYENQKIQQLRKSILECKEKSYTQKNQFVELQSSQFRVQTEIRELEEEQQKFEEENIRRQKYQQMLKIKDKILNATENMEIEVVPHLERKIEKMAQLRSELKNIDQALGNSIVKIQDQNIVIEALREKSYHQQAYYSEEGNLYDQYRRKYNQIYFGGVKSSKNDSVNNSEWNDYSLYLKHLVSKNRNANKRIYTEVPDLLTRKNFSQSTSKIEGSKKIDFSNNTRKSSGQDDVLDLRSKNTDSTKREGRQSYGDSKKVSKNPQMLRGDKLPPKKQSTGSTKLPKLVKLEGKASQQKNIKNKVKEGMANNKNILNDEDISLESIHSNDSNVSGQIIEVQFHKKS